MARTHPNVLKVKKQGRMRRAYLKSYFGLIKVGQSIDKTKVPRGAEGIFDYRQRGNLFWDDYLEKKFPSRGRISVERYRVLDRLKELTQEVVPELNVVVKKGGITKTIIRFYFASDFSHCFFMKEDWTNNVFYKSSPYGGPGCRDRAMFDLEHNRLNWIERIEFSSIIPDVPPSG